MPVNLPEIAPASLTPIQGIRLGWAESNRLQPAHSGFPLQIAENRGAQELMR